jgi:phosphoribosyl-ATP pyrophosphohydrolase
MTTSRHKSATSRDRNGALEGANVDCKWMSRFTIHDLAATIDARAASGGEGSYTRKLLDKGAEHCAKKLGEEAVETVIAAVENNRDHLIAETADLLFHLLVLLKSRDVKIEDVEAALAQRTAMSGLEEKAARKRDN